MHLALLVLIILVPLVCGVVLPKVLDVDGLRFGVALSLGGELLLVAVACMLPDMPFAAVWKISDGLVLGLWCDGACKFFACIFSALSLVVGTFAFEYLSTSHQQQRFFRYFLLLESALLALCFSGNLISFLVFFGAAAFLALPLIAHEESRNARSTALIYLAHSLSGLCIVLFGLLFLMPYGGGQPFSVGGALALEASSSQLLVGLYFLMALGFGATAGLAPFHAWLPIAELDTPSPISACISSTITAAGILGILRLTYNLLGTSLLIGSWAQTTLMALALATILLGSILAFREPVFKRRLAYASVSQISCALLGLWIMSPEGLLGGLMQFVFHAIATSCAFLFAGAFAHQTGKIKTYDLRGAGSRMPVSAFCFVIAALSLVGLPPTGGFVTRWHLGMAALPHAPLGKLSAATLILSSLLTAAYLLPLVSTMFFPTRQDTLPDVREPAPLMRYPLVALALALVALGLFSGPLTRAIQNMGLM